MERSFQNNTIASGLQVKKLYVISLALYLLILPVNTGLTGFLSGVSISNYFAAICIILGFLQFNASIKTFPIFGIPLALFYSFAVLSLLWSSISSGVWFVSTFVVNYLIVLSGVWFCYEKRDCVILENSILAGLIIAIIAAIINIETVQNNYRLIVYFPRYIDPNYFACDLYPIIALSFVRIFDRKSRTVFHILVFVATLIVVFLSGSRGAMLGIIFMIGIYFMLNGEAFKNIVIYFAPLASFLLVLTILIFDFSGSGLIQRFSISSILSGHGTGRFAIWRDALSVFKSSDIFHCIFGYGLGSFKGVVNSVSSFGVYYAHNMIIQMLIEVGLLGIILLITAYICLFIISSKCKSVFSLTLLVGVFIASLSLDIESTRLLGVAFLLPFVYWNASNTDTECEVLR